MRPFYFKNYSKECGYFDDLNPYSFLRESVRWVNRDAPRDECFMANEELSYTYGSFGFSRTYNSVLMNSFVKILMDDLNDNFDCNYNVCFLNYYKNEKQHLGSHSDDSPEMDKNHSITVISFGAEREIWVKEKGFSGNIPAEDKFLLNDGSLFIMPSGYQEKYLHKIPKWDKPCGGRISLTFRKFNK